MRLLRTFGAGAAAVSPEGAAAGLGAALGADIEAEPRSTIAGALAFFGSFGALNRRASLLSASLERK
jgi:hypothetical protein